jgi:hypothetical protein
VTIVEIEKGMYGLDTLMELARWLIERGFSVYIKEGGEFAAEKETAPPKGDEDNER